MNRCRECSRILWPLTDATHRIVGHACPHCDGMGEWPRFRAARHVRRIVRPDTELQRDVDGIIRGTPYDWEVDGI